MGKLTFGQLLKLNQGFSKQHFYPKIVNLKPKYCEAYLHFRPNYRNNAGYFSHQWITRLCDFTLEMAMESQSSHIINPQPRKVTLEILKETKAQISAICDWQEHSAAETVTISVQDVEGDAIAYTQYHF